MSALGKRKEMSAMDALAEVCELKLVAIAQKKNDEPVIEKTLFDALGVDLVFDNVIKALFSFENGVESYTSLALVCRMTYARATHGGRAKRILAQAYPYLPPMYKNPEDWQVADGQSDAHPIRELTDAQAFSLIRFLSNGARTPTTLKGVPRKLYRVLVDLPLSVSSLSMNYNDEIENDGGRYYAFDPREWGASAQDRNAQARRNRVFTCTPKSRKLEIAVDWYADADNKHHSRVVVFHMAPGNYTVEAAGDPNASKVNVIVHEESKPFQLQQITIDCSKIGNCGDEAPLHNDEEENDLHRRNLCLCKKVRVHGSLHGDAGHGVSGHIYDFTSIVEADKKALAEREENGVKRARKMTQKKLCAVSGIAQRLLTCVVTSNTTAFIDLRTHAVSLVKCENASVKLARNQPVAGGPSWLVKSSVCAIVPKTGPVVQQTLLPHFAYQC